MIFDAEQDERKPFAARVGEYYSLPFDEHKRTVTAVYDNMSPMVMALIQRHESELLVTRDLRERLLRATNALCEAQHEIHLIRGEADTTCKICCDDADTSQGD